MMKRLTLALLIFLVCVQTHADIAVITNLQNDFQSLSKKEVEELFMGRNRTFPNGTTSLPLDSVALRSDFYTKLTDRPIEQVNAYWARIMFSGQASPPIKISDEEEVIKTVIENKGAIGYVDQQKINKKQVKVILLLH